VCSSFASRRRRREEENGCNMCARRSPYYNLCTKQRQHRTVKYISETLPNKYLRNFCTHLPSCRCRIHANNKQDEEQTRNKLKKKQETTSRKNKKQDEEQTRNKDEEQTRSKIKKQRDTRSRASFNGPLRPTSFYGPTGYALHDGVLPIIKTHPREPESP